MNEGSEDTGVGESVAVCPQCHTAAGADERFCRRCGGRLPQPGAPAGPGETDHTSQMAAASRVTAAHAPARVATEVSPAPSVSGGRTCPSCRAANSWSREVCGQCGADLDTGAALPRLDPDPEPRESPRNGDEPPHRRSWWLPVAAAAGVVVLVVGGLMLAGVGPFEREPEIPEIEFDATRYPDEPRELVLSDIATMTTLRPAGPVVYAPTQMVDDDPATAWNSDGSQLPDGVGEKIDLFLAQPAWIDRFVIANGDHSDSDTYAANARIKRARLTFDGGVTVIINLLDQGLQQQAVEFEQPALTTTVRIEVLESFPGDTHANLAVSDLELHGWRADDEDAELAGERAELRPAAGAVVLPEFLSDTEGP